MLCVSVAVPLAGGACTRAATVPTPSASDPEQTARPVARPSSTVPLGWGAIPLEGDANSVGDLPWRLTLYGRHPASLAEVLSEHARIEEVTDIGVVVSWDYVPPSADGTILTQHAEPSFYVDFDEPAMKPLIDALRESSLREPSAAELEAFVASHIEGETNGRFDPASRVATRREGDCSEHAVLLAALGRAFGIPSRLVFGYIMQPKVGRAVGHASTELHDGKRWVPHDAARDDPVDNRYLKVAVVEDEGFRMGWPVADKLRLIEGIRILPPLE